VSDTNSNLATGYGLNLIIPELPGSSGIFDGRHSLDATTFEGVKTICRHIGRLSLQVATKKMKKLGSSDFSS
jgi:hypothetical protein